MADKIETDSEGAAELLRHALSQPATVAATPAKSKKGKAPSSALAAPDAEAANDIDMVDG